MDRERQKNDRQRLCSIFPEVVWLLICHRLLNYPETWECVYHASTFLRQLLHSRRNSFLFSKILKLEYMNPLHRPIQQLQVLLYFDTVHYGSPKSENTFLKLRLICKSWSISLDKILQSQIKSLGCGYALTGYKKHDKFDWEPKFLTHFESSHQFVPQSDRGPFIGNAVSLVWFKGVSRDMPEHEFLPENMPFRHLLKRYGHHIHYLYLQFWQGRPLEGWYPPALFQILKRLTNLKMLKLSLCCTNLRNVNWQNVFSDIPKFVKLENLNLNARFGHQFVNTIMSKMPNLKSLTTNLERDVGHSHIQNIFPDALLQDLEQLTVNFDILACNNGGDHVCEIYQALHNMLLTLEAHSPLQRLTSLHFELPCTMSSTWQDLQHYQIITPKLKRFSLNLKNWPCIDLILLFSGSLEHLTLRMELCQTFDEWIQTAQVHCLKEREQIKFLSCNGILDKNHNIWTLIPQLRTVMVSVCIRTSRGSNRSYNTWERYADV